MKVWEEEVTPVPWLRPLLEHLIAEDFGSILRTRISEISTSCPVAVMDVDGYDKGDRFLLQVPYAEEYLEWEVCFQWNNPNAVPEVDFLEDEDFLPEANQNEEIQEWESSNPACLSVYIVWLLEKYKEWQLDKCQSFPALRQLLDAAFKSKPKYRDMMDVRIITEEGSRQGEVMFLMSLTVRGLTELPIALRPTKSGQPCTLQEDYEDLLDEEDTVLLKVSYRDFGEGRASTQLVLSPFLNQLLSLYDFMEVPRVRPDQHYHEYVEFVQRMLDEKVYFILACFERRQQFVQLLIESRANELLEVDTVSWRKVSFLINQNDFQFIFTVELPLDLYKEQCWLMLISVYHEYQGPSGLMKNLTLNEKRDCAARQREEFQPYRRTEKYKIETRKDPAQFLESFERKLMEMFSSFQRLSCSRGT